MRVRPRELNAESPSKNCVSGMVPPTASRLNQPFELIVTVDREEEESREVREVGGMRNV